MGSVAQQKNYKYERTRSHLKVGAVIIGPDSFGLTKPLQLRDEDGELSAQLSINGCLRVSDPALFHPCVVAGTLYLEEILVT